MSAAATHSDTVAMEKGTKHSCGRAFRDQLPSLREFASNEWKDILGLIVVTVFSQAMNASPPIARRNFQLPSDLSSIADYSWPYREQIITVPVSAVLASILPIVIFALAQIRIKSYADLHASVYGILTTLVNGTFMQCVLKTGTGGIRPYFFSACLPGADWVPGSGTGFGGNVYTTDICTGNLKNINKALTSWPSGHSNAAMGSMLFLALYLNAKLKIFADTRGRYWKMFCFFLPLLFGTAICGTLLFDHTHHYYDVMTGATIGMLNALAAYRMRYAAVFDFRFNHIPLPKSTYISREEEKYVYHGGTIPGSDHTTAHKKGKFAVGKRSEKPRSKTIKHAQRFTYDLDAIASSSANHGHHLSGHNNNASTMNTGHQTPIAPSPGPSTWHTGGRGAIPEDPMLNPVLTRRWQGSSVGAPNDAAWGQTMEGSTLGIAHSAMEYGRATRNGNGAGAEGHGDGSDVGGSSLIPGEVGNEGVDPTVVR